MNQKTAKLIRRAVRNLGVPHRTVKADWNRVNRPGRRAMRKFLKSVAMSYTVSEDPIRFVNRSDGVLEPYNPTK